MTIILLVDDEPDILTIGAMALEDIGGFVVRSVSSGTEALESLAQALADIIVLDVMMPVIDGPTTLERLRAIPGCERTPVIFLTAQVQQHEIARFRALGAVGVIRKPFDPMTLAQDVRELVA